jgi:hypothetical protein
MKNFNKFINRMKSIGITLECIGNYPWVYIDKINGKRVTEIFHAEHGFTIGFQPTNNSKEFKFTDMKEIFKLIRRYR